MLNKMMVLLALTLFSLQWVTAEATVFQQMSYQGILTDNAGNRITGTRTLTFKIYNSASGDTVCWQKDTTISIQDGIVNVILGPISGCDATQQWWLEITVGGDSAMERIQLTAVPYSMYTAKAANSELLDGYDNTDFIKLCATNNSNCRTIIQGEYGGASLVSIENNSTTYYSSGIYAWGQSFGVYGEGTQGVYGLCSNGNTEGALGDPCGGVYGRALGGGAKAGCFDGDVHVDGDFHATGTLTAGNKQFIHPHPTDPTKNIVYVSLEGGEAGTYIRGSGQLSNGTAVIDLPEHFGLVTSPKGLTVQITPRDAVASGYLYAEFVTPSRLVVKEANNGATDAKFDYLVQGIRIGYENHQPIQTKER